MFHLTCGHQFWEWTVVVVNSSEFDIGVPSVAEVTSVIAWFCYFRKLKSDVWDPGMCPIQHFESIVCKDWVSID